MTRRPPSTLASDHDHPIDALGDWAILRTVCLAGALLLAHGHAVVVLVRGMP